MGPFAILIKDWFAIMLYICLLVVAFSPFADSVQTLYAQQDAEGLRHLLETAQTREQEWLVRYRLYPLTEDASVVKGLPAELEDGTARELALLAGLWAYRAGTVSFLRAFRYGRRSVNFLERAYNRDPQAPYVLLVRGQSLLFRPAIAGSDAEEAAQAFQRLVGILQNHPEAGISRTEAQSWQWLALRECGEAEQARALHADLLSRNPPPLYHQFLTDPPQV
jgi:hypothetical protein